MVTSPTLYTLMWILIILAAIDKIRYERKIHDLNMTIRNLHETLISYQKILLMESNEQKSYQIQTPTP